MKNDFDDFLTLENDSWMASEKARNCKNTYCKYCNCLAKSYQSHLSPNRHRHRLKRATKVYQGIIGIGIG